MVFPQILRVRRAGVPLGWLELFSLGLRGALTRELADALIENHRLDVGLDLETLEAQALAKGNPASLVSAAATLRDAGLEVPTLSLAAHDLAGASLGEAVQVFIALRARHPSLSFGEVSGRTLRGEDLLRAAKNGTFAPLAPPTRSGQAERIGD